MASSAATASLFPAPFAPLWKASSTGSPNERFTFANLREKRSSHRNIRTIVCAGERKKSLSQKLKEKKTANSGDVTSEIEQTEEDNENVEVTEKTRSEDIVKTMPSVSKVEDEASTFSSKDVKQREVDYALAKQKIEEEVKKYSSEKQTEQLTEGLKITEDLEATQRREQEFELMMKEEAEKRKKKVEEELAAARQREIELKEKMERRKKLEQEARLAVARERERVAKEEAKKREIMRLAELNTSRLSKIFYYPLKVEASAQVEIFFNKGITLLAEQEAVHILYSFNGWRWQSFTSKLEKNDVAGGDWWSCKIDVPREAYKIDFVFFNGENVYENNESNDFHLLVEGAMDEQEFEAFLSLEKRKEAEKIALEQAERDRAAEEARKRAETLASEEADKAEVKKIVSEQRECAHKLMQKAANSIPGVWDIEPASFRGGQTVKLFYNRGLRPLKDSLEVWIHGGYNNWKEAVSITRKLSKEDSRPGDWWSVEVYVPKSAFMLNWVFADGPPEKATIYDNNNYQDFHTAVPAPILEDLYWANVEEKVYSDLRKERKTREEETRKKAELKAKMKEEMKQKARREFLQSHSHIYYTDPMEVRAGKRVSLLYNPLNTVLNGKPEIWLRHSFNRWTHWLNPFPPIKMVGAPNSFHLKATLEVPEDAYMMDFVFSERGDELGGVYDNRNGFDYHIPVMRSTTKEPPMSIVHISVEMAPIAKVGGLGDVVTSLSRAVQELGHNVEVILPKYDCLKYHHVQDLQEKESFEWGGTRIRVWNGKVEGVNVHFIEPENGLFWVGCIYGRRDDGNRFGFFCSASLEFLLRSGRHPDVIHCHDWSTAPVAWLFQESYKHYGLSNARIVFTIHNMEFGIAQIGKAMANANMATTVSHSYAQEVSGNPAISPHRGKFHGIRNGIDLDIWDPFDDPYIPASYTADRVVEGKGAAKVELQHRLGLERVDKPLLGIISRLTAQKGIHLIKHAIWRTLDRGGQVVLLGSAPDPRVQNDFVNLSNQLRNSHNDMARLCLTYDEPLSHLIYAGADIILVPSIFEPCGLTQLIAMRYGAIPVVRKTGGLNDTVFDVDHDRERARSQGLESNGFSFEGTDAAGVDYALNRALSAWYETRDWFNWLSKKVMEQDWSWNRPALDYVELYYVAKK